MHAGPTAHADAKGKADTQRARTARAANSSELSSADAETSRLRQLRDLQAQLNWWKKRWDARQAAVREHSDGV